MEPVEAITKGIKFESIFGSSEGPTHFLHMSMKSYELVS